MEAKSHMSSGPACSVCQITEFYGTLLKSALAFSRLIPVLSTACVKVEEMSAPKNSFPLE